MTQNQSKMDELRALDRRIAEAFGHTTREVITDGYDGYFSTGTRVFVLSDGGLIPHFSVDANAVLSFCTKRGWHLSFTGNTALIVRDVGDGFAHTHRGDGATPQEAGARALLAALEAVNGKTA